MNRQVKRQMAKQEQGARPPRGGPPNPRTERTTPVSYLKEVQGEMKRVAWPPRAEIMNSTVVVIIGVVIMTALIFGFDYLAGGLVNHIF